MEELASAWEKRLRRDLTGFADRGHEVAVYRTETQLEATWRVRGRERTEIFGLSPEGSLAWLNGPRGDEQYGEFLRSETMADFDQLAESIVALTEVQEHFVPSDAVIDDGFDHANDVTATPTLLAELAGRGTRGAEGSTALYFLKGDPGAGKTTLLRHAVADQARRYLKGDTPFLFFYVSAQGRELSNLRDAFSGELHDLRAGFTRDAIPALVRTGLLVPVVDGFDELLGTAGYGGAFSSLQSLLSELEGQGALAVSARSSFYDLEFLGRATEANQAAEIRVTTIALKPWTDEQLTAYVAKFEADTTEALATLTDADKALLRRPFFASQFPSYVAQLPADRTTENPDRPLLEFLIEAYIQRESTKIVDSNGAPVLPVTGHQRLFELAASEMWESETRQLDRDDLLTVTEMVAEEFNLGSDEAMQLLTKITSYAGFSAGPSGGKPQFVFEHEVYFDYFLARALNRLLSETRTPELNQALDRGVITTAVAEAAVSSLADELAADLAKCPAGIRYENRRRNLGTLLAAVARKNSIVNLEIEGLAFVDLDFRGATFHEAVFQQCTFVGVDLSGASFTHCLAEGSSFHAISCDNSSHLDIQGLRPGANVNILRHPVVGDVYAPTDVAKVLKRLGAPLAQDRGRKYSELAAVYIKLLQHVARSFRRTNILFEGDTSYHSFLKSKYWPELRSVLLDTGVVTEEVRAVSGPKTTALRLRVTVDQLLAGESADGELSGPAAKLWAELRAM